MQEQGKIRRKQTTRSPAGRGTRRWLLLGGGALAVVVAVALVVVAALSRGVSPTPQAEGVPSAGHALGRADAPVTLTEFSDFQ